MFKIYLVEDEKNLANLLIKYLELEGYTTKHFITGEEAFSHIEEDVDLWILDIMLPGHVSGYDLIKKIREKDNKKPIIFTSARDQDIDKIMGLELGSDDYIPKPYSPREVMLRIKNILQRCYDFKEDNVINYNEYKIDEEKRSAFLNDELINLTSKEYELLIYLVKNKGNAFSREQILDSVWGSDYYGSDRVVDDLMRRLRQKMDKLDVETIYGYGYRLK